MTSVISLYAPNELDVTGRIREHELIALVPVVPLKLVAKLRRFGIVNLGQLYALDCQDMRLRLGLDDDQVTLLETSLKAAAHPPIAVEKTGSPYLISPHDKWVRFNWPWLPATDPISVTLVPAGAIGYLPPLWFCRTESQIFAVDWLLSQGLATTVADLEELTAETVAASLLGLDLQRPIEGREPDKFTPEDIMICVRLVVEYINQVREGNYHG